MDSIEQSPEDQECPGFSADTSGCDNCIRDAIEDVADVLKGMSKKLDNLLKPSCEDVTGCIDEIIAAIDDRIGGAAYSCTQCREMAAAGMDGTLNYLIHCAQCSIDECTEDCSETEEALGYCTKCQKKECNCDKEKPEKEPEKKPEDTTRYVGWCNRVSGVVIVLREGAASPGIDFEATAVSPDESQAYYAARSYCSQQQRRPEREDIQPLAEVSSAGLTGECNSFFETLSTFLSNNAAGGAGAQWVNGVRNVMQGISTNIVAEIGGGLVQSLVGMYQSQFTKPLEITDLLIKGTAAAVGCSDPSFASGLHFISVMNQVGQYLGVNPLEYNPAWEYAMRASCPTKMLSPQEALAAFLGNAFDDETLNKHWAIAGYCRESAGQAMYASRSKPNARDLAVMRHRDIITDVAYHKGMRENGYLDTAVSELLFDASFQVPSVSDIIRFMVRDAGDDGPGGIVQRFKLDTEFDKKYNGQLRQWARDQGMPDKVAQYAWRSHWGIPSPGQLFTFYHRLRNDKEFGDVLGDVKAALIQQDILPYWHKHYLAVSFLPMGRIDIRRAHSIGSVTDDELKPLYDQLGYSDKTSEILAKFTVRLRDKAASSHQGIKQWISGTLTLDQALAEMAKDGIPPNVARHAAEMSQRSFLSSPLSRSFLAGLLSRLELLTQLQSRGVTTNGAESIANELGLRKTQDDAIEDLSAGTIDRTTAIARMSENGIDSVIVRRIVSKVDNATKRRFAINCQRGVKRRYLTGELTADESRNELIATGTNLEYAAGLVDNWNCEKRAMGKHVPAAKLCDWLGKGILQPGEFVDRLRNIGFSETDAKLMLADCLATINYKRMKDAERIATEQTKDDTRRQRELQRTNALLEKQQKQAYMAQKAAVKAKNSRDKQLFAAIEKLKAATGDELGVVVAFVRSEQSRVRQEYGITVDQSLQVLLVASEDGGIKTLADYPGVVSQLAQQILDKANSADMAFA